MGRWVGFIDTAKCYDNVIASSVCGLASIYSSYISLRLCDVYRSYDRWDVLYMSVIAVGD